MSEALYLALDQGGHASRAMVFDGRGRVISQASVNIGVWQGEGQRVEHDAGELVASVLQAAEAALELAGEQRQAIRCVGLATQRSSLACWDRITGEALSPVISWQDRRAAAEIAAFESSRSMIHERTGLMLSAHYGASKLRWCLRHLPQVKQAAIQKRLACGPLASYLIYRLAKERPLLADPANASRTLLWNFRDLDWDARLLQLFAIEAALLPRCVPSRHDYGTLNLRDQAIPLAVVNGDQSAALFAFGEPRPEITYINVGTGAFVQRLLGGTPVFAERLLTSVVWQEAGQVMYVLEGTVNGAGSALAQITQTLGIPAETLQAHAEEWLARCADPPLFLNGVSGLGSPYWIADFPSRFVGPGEDWEQLVAVFESIVFLLMENIHALAPHTVPSQHIVITGGLSVLDGLCQRLADLARQPVYRPVQCEATARGTAFLLAGRPDHWPEPVPGIWFEPQADAGLEARYRRWQSALSETIADL